MILGRDCKTENHLNFVEKLDRLSFPTSEGLHPCGARGAGWLYGLGRLNILVTLTVALTVGATNAWAGNVGPDDAARLYHGVNASLRYQLYQPNSSVPPQKIDAAMAPVLGAIKNALLAGVSTTDLVALHDAAIANAAFVANNLSPEEQVSAMIDFISDLVDPKNWGKLNLDLVKAEILAYRNSQNISDGEINNALQPAYIQQSIDAFIMKVIGDSYTAAISNPTFAQNFNQIFASDLQVNITDNATTISNTNLNLPDYFRTVVNSDGSLTVDIAGLENVYGQQSTTMTQTASNAVNIAALINQYEQQNIFSNASLNTILQGVSAEAKQQAQQQYVANQQSIATAQAGMNLASNLAAFFNPGVSKEITTYGNAATQLATAANYLANGELSLVNSLTTASNVAGAALAIYNLLQGGLSPDAVVQQQLAAIGKAINLLRQDMDQRFDLIDTNLNTIYNTINTGFNVIIPDLNTIIQQLSTLQGDLNEFERNFYNVETAVALAQLNSGITGCIAFRQIFGVNMNAAQYQACENTFYSWATQNAQTLATLPTTNRFYDDDHVFNELSQVPNSSSLGFFPTRPTSITSVSIPSRGSA